MIFYSIFHPKKYFYFSHIIRFLTKNITIKIALIKIAQTKKVLVIIAIITLAKKIILLHKFWSKMFSNFN